MRRFPENAHFFLSSVDVFTQMSTFSPHPFVGAIGYPFAVNFLGFLRLFVCFLSSFGSGSWFSDAWHSTGLNICNLRVFGSIQWNQEEEEVAGIVFQLRTFFYCHCFLLFLQYFGLMKTFTFLILFVLVLNVLLFLKLLFKEHITQFLKIC